MLTLISGNPGNGKSLWTTTTVEALRLKDQREVYQDGIDGLTYGWKPLPMTEIEVAKGRTTIKLNVPNWAEVPDGSVVVIDEAWRVFPVRAVGAPVPEYVQFLATHRHHGLDIFLATQSVKTQVDSFVRGLCGKHVHLDRKFGMEYAMVYQWERVADPTSKGDLSVAQSGRWLFPKQNYGTYKSAVEHTHKRQLPWKKIITLFSALAVVVGGTWAAFDYLRPHPKEAATGGVLSGRGSAVKDGTDFWLKDRRMRVAGYPASAPVFDQLQHVRSQPRPEGCMRMDIGNSVHCSCTGPNHSQLEIPVAMCLDYVKNGFFDETRNYPDPKIANVQALERNGVQGTATAARENNNQTQ